MTETRSMHGWALMSMLLLACVWGGSFASMKALLNAGLGVGVMLALRFTLGALGLALFVRILGIRIERRALLDGLWLGLILSVIFWLQADGLRHTTTSKSGFITGLYVIFTPAISLMQGQRPRFSHAIGAALATLGLFLLVREPGAAFGGWNFGDSETLLCAFGCGFHIIYTGRFGKRSNGWVLALVQVSVVALLSWLFAVIVPPVAQPNGTRLGGFQGLGMALSRPDVWWGLLYLSVLATTLAFYLMSTFQKYLGATEAAVVYSLEPVFAACIAISGLVPGIREHLAPVQLAGGAVILGAMLLAELGPRLLASKTEQVD